APDARTPVAEAATAHAFDRRRRYRTATPLAHGGAFMETFRAYDPTLERDVGLAFPHTETPEQLERILRDARTLTTLTPHPNIGQIYSVGESEGRPYIAMQLIEDQPLRTLLPWLDRATRLALIQQIVDALRVAHSAGVLHRNLSLDAVRARRDDSGDWQAVVVDFGLGHTCSSTLLHAAPSAAIAPELLSRGSHVADARSEVYAVGAMLYEALTNRPPLEASTPIEQIRQTLDVPPTPPRQHDASIPAALETIVLTCLDKQPDQRYVSFDALGTDLRRARFGQSIRRSRSTMILRASLRRWQRSARLVPAAAIMTLALVATIAWLLLDPRTHIEQAQSFEAMRGRTVHALRLAHLRPPHDLQPLRARLARDLERLETEALDALPRRARAEAHVALGRSWLALDDLDRAAQHFEQAWADGARTLAVHYGFGRVLDARYDRALSLAVIEHDDDLRQLLRERARAQFQDRVRDLYAQARAEDPVQRVPMAYLDALIALHDGRYGDALGHLEPITDGTIDHPESVHLVARVFTRWAGAMRADSRLTDALDLHRQAAQVLLDASAQAPSDPRLARALCATRRAQLTIAQQQLRAIADTPDAGVGLRSAAYHLRRGRRLMHHGAIERCRMVHTLLPDDVTPLLREAETHWLRAREAPAAPRRARRERMINRRLERLREAHAAIDRVLAHTPDCVHGRMLRGDVWHAEARLRQQLDPTFDPRALIDRGQLAYRRALLRSGDHPPLLARTLHGLRAQADARCRTGQPRAPTLREAQRLLQRDDDVRALATLRATRDALAAGCPPPR
ncbi:MAG: protein kinase, partial [Acidobacteriota bacterium]